MSKKICCRCGKPAFEPRSFVLCKDHFAELNKDMHRLLGGNNSNKNTIEKAKTNE